MNCGRSTSASGRCPARSNLSNSDGPKPIVSVSRDGFSPSASPVSSGGASARPPYAPSPTAFPAVIRRAAAVQSFSIATNSARSSVSTSNAAKCSRSCTGVAIPAWWVPWKATAAPAAGAASSPVRATATAPCGRGGTEREPGTAPADQRTPRGSTGVGGFGGGVVVGHRHFTTAAASWERGSASAFTASDSSFCSALPTLS